MKPTKEEIKKESEKIYSGTMSRKYFIDGANWYAQQSESSLLNEVVKLRDEYKKCYKSLEISMPNLSTNSDFTAVGQKHFFMREFDEKLTKIINKAEQ